MWLHRFTHYLLKHRLQALAITFLITFVPLIGIVGILIAALVTLCQGIVAGAIFTVAATLPYAVSFYLTGRPDEHVALVVWAAVGVAILSNLLTWMFAVMLRRKTSWNVILQVAALLGVLVISLVHLAFPEVSDWWGRELQAYYNQAQAVAGVMKTQPPGSADLQVEAINATKIYATGLMTAAILFNAVLQLVVARWWQTIVFEPGALRKELHYIRLSQLAGALFVISLVLSYLGNGVVLDIMPVLYILFAAAGLSLIHYFFGQWKSQTTWFWLSLLYLTLLFSLPASLVVISAFAVVDSWIDVRKRFKKV